jgi:hypothetical protein
MWSGRGENLHLSGPRIPNRGSDAHKFPLAGIELAGNGGGVRGPHANSGRIQVCGHRRIQVLQLWGLYVDPISHVPRRDHSGGGK